MSVFSRLHSKRNRSDGDNLELSDYAKAMERGQPYIRLRIDVPGAIELGAFVGAFTSLASEYERFMKADGQSGEATLYVAEVRQGSIIADLIPHIQSALPVLGGLAGNALDIEEFVRRYGSRLLKLARGGPVIPDDTTKSELRDFTEQVAAIANTPGSTLEIAAVKIVDGEHVTEAAFKFRTDEARQIRDRAELTRQQIEQTSRADHERVFMVFVRSDIRSAALGKNTGEWVKIEVLTEKPRPLVYASAMAEQEIKAEIADDDSVFKKGFVVDVNVEMRGGKPVAYAVTNLHQVVDLPDDDD